MFCNQCGKELPDGSRFCNRCGAEMPVKEPRHARPESEEIFSHSDRNEHSEFDVTPLGMNQQDTTEISQRTQVYDFALFEEPEAPPREMIDDREIINDSFDNYTEDDGTFMDKLDRQFRRDDDDDDDEKKNNTWLWVLLGVVAAILVIAIGFVVVKALNNGTDKDNKPTSAATVATQPATRQATEAPTEKPTEAPTEKPTEAPTQAPETEPPAPTEPPVPEPTDPPEPEPTDPPIPEPTELPAPDIYE